MSQITSTSSATSSASTNLASSTAALSSNDALANEGTFLKLLVAQLQNQDPLQPQDGTQFVSQLAQFSGLEQNLAMRSDLDAIKTHVVGSATSTTSTGVTTSA
jgi:flagellar basal-body rod modification protein FlgD